MRQTSRPLTRPIPGTSLLILAKSSIFRAHFVCYFEIHLEIFIFLNIYIRVANLSSTGID